MVDVSGHVTASLPRDDDGLPRTVLGRGSATVEPVVLRRSVGRGFGSIQSKLLVMLLATGILSTAVVGFFGYRSGTQALRDATYERLAEVGDARLTAVGSMVGNLRAAVRMDSQGVGVDASVAFNQAYGELAASTISPDQLHGLEGFYRDDFAPKLQENVGGNVDPAAFVPTLPARRYLQAHYTVQSTDFDKSILVDDAGDGSRWSAVNRRYNPYFRDVVEALQLDDVLMLDNQGNVVYSAYKGAELGSNIEKGEYRGGGLQAVYDAAVRSNSLGTVAVADFEQYVPSYGKPTMFLASPIGTASNLTGVLVYEVSIDSLNGVLSGHAKAGKFEGLGSTGEAYLVGADGTLRTDSRELFSDPKEFAAEAVSAGADPDVVDRIVRTKSDVNLLRDRSTPAARAGLGESGVVETRDYLGHQVLASYAPAELPDLDWSLVTKIGTEEALAPVKDFERNLLLATAGIILLICVLSVFVARIFTSPLEKLVTGVRAVAGGKLGAQVDSGDRHDEFGDLGQAFNDMSTSLFTKQQLLEAQQKENDRLLASLMPEEVARRYRGGETGISEDHHDVSVVYVGIEGFDAFAARRPAAEALDLLNMLSRGFDDAAGKAGVEKVRSLGTGYVASSGLTLQRVDHARRVVDFALDVAAVVDRFNNQNGSSLVMRAGIDTGDVQSGLVGRTDVVYSLWGDAVDLAFTVRTVAGEAGIYVTDEVRERLGHAYDFEQVGEISRNDSPRAVWRLSKAA